VLIKSITETAHKMKHLLILFFSISVFQLSAFSQTTSTILGLTDATTISADDKVWLADVDGATADVDATLEQIVSPFAADPSSNSAFDPVEWAADLNITSAWGDVTGTPITISGYGITDAYTRSEVDASFALVLYPGADVSSLFNDLGYIDGSTLDGSSVDSGVVRESYIDASITRDAELSAAITSQSFKSGVRFLSDGSAEFAGGMCDFGFNDFSFIFQLRLDDYTPSAAGELIATHSSGDNRLSVTVESDGDWRLSFTDSGSTLAVYDITPASSLVDGVAYLVALTCARGGDATLYIAGNSAGSVDISASSVVSLGDSNVTQGALFSGELAGSFGKLLVCNFELSAGEVLEVSSAGPMVWLGLDPNLLQAGATGPTSSVYFKLSGSGTVSNGTISSFDLDAGASGLATNHLGSFAINSGQTVRANITISGDLDNGNVVLVSGANLSEYVLLQVGTVDYLITAPTDLPYGDLRFTSLSSSDGMSVVVNSVEFVGVTAALPCDEGLGYQLRDTSDAAYDMLLSTSGVAHLRTKTEGYVRDFSVDAYSGGAGNAELVSSTRNVLPAGAILTAAIVRNNTGTITGGLLDLKRSSRSAYNVIGDNGQGLSGGQQALIVANEGVQSSAYLNVALDGSGDPDATSVDIRVNYKVIK